MSFMTNMVLGIKISYRMATLQIKAITDRLEMKTLSNEQAETPVKSLFMIFIIAVLAGALLPTGIASLKTANTSTWTTSEIATYGIITIMVLIAVVMLVARIAME